MAFASMRAKSTRSVAAYLAFFLSGASSLIFQTIWTRMLIHVFGATSVAISTVLTVFMGGLGLGAWLGGKYANKIKHPIIAYAVAEIGVGIWGLLVPLLVKSDGWLAGVNELLRAEFGAESGMFMITRFLCVAPILFIPTTLMGSTLPLLTRHFVSTTHGSRDAGTQVGALYAINTFGAATGPLLSAFFLLPSLGLSITNIVACSMNFTLAILIFSTKKTLLAGSWKPGERLLFWPGTAEDPGAPAPEDERPPEKKPKRKKKGQGGPSRELPPPKDPRGADRFAARVSGLFACLVLAGGVAAASQLAVRVGLGVALVVVAGVVFYLGRGRGEATEETKEETKGDEQDAPVPELARKAAFLAFAASGAAALGMEVVWSRALAMTIGSSIYSFSLILETFLIGIATGSAAMAAFMGRRTSPIVGVGLASAVLVLLANVPWAIEIVNPTDTDSRFHGDTWSYLLLNISYIAPIAIGVVWLSLKIRRGGQDSDVFRDDLAVWRLLITDGVVALPVVAATINVIHFPGFLPQIILSVVGSIALFLLAASLLAHTPVLLIAIVQLYIAGATTVSYYWQDEIPYAFAQLVAGIPRSALPDRVGTVQFFMFVTIVLCTLPSTLGMGAMFPLTVRLWTQGGKGIARDVAVVYTGNTLGSIVGAWLPGFILFALIGAEHTLHVGITLNMLLALGLLIAGAADPGEDQTWWTWRRVACVGLPMLAAAVMGVSAAAGGMQGPEFITKMAAAVGFVALGLVEFQWLQRCGRSEISVGAAAVVAGVPLITTLALAYQLITPALTEEWAVRAVVVALKAFLVLVGAVVTWGSWREWSGATVAQSATASEA